MTDETIFAAALEKTDPVERATYLVGACAGDVKRRQRIERLLSAHEGAGSFLEHPAVAAPDPDRADARTVAHDSVGLADTDEALRFLAPPTRPDSLGRIGHYEVLEVLGRGGFGIVFRAFDDVLQRVVAVKVLAPQMATTSPARKRFIREARSSAQIRHENVVQVHAVEELPLPFLVMEFVPGETLQQRLDRSGPLDVAEILRISRQLAEGLAAAHAQGLVHRDIKPSNVLIGGPNQHVKLTDFGLARAADDASISQSGIVAGTPMYMAPEQARGDTLDHRADLFSLGSVIYVMCSGRPPFRASGTLAVLKRVCDEDPRPIREVIPEIPEWLCRIVEKLHAKDPDQRYQSAKEVAAVLADCERQLQEHSTLVDVARIPAGKPARPTSWLAVWIVGVIVVAVPLAGLMPDPGLALLVFTSLVCVPIVLSSVWSALSPTSKGPALAGAPVKHARPKTPAPRSWVPFVAALVLLIVCSRTVVFGPFVALYLGDQGEVEVVPDPELVSVIVHQGDGAVTDWFDVSQHPQIKLPPGKYKLEPGFRSLKRTAAHWEITTHGLLTGHSSRTSADRAPGFEIKRGERVTIRVVMRDNPQRTDHIADPEPSPVAVPFGAAAASELQKSWSRHLILPVEYTNSVGMKFRLIPPGRMPMGSTPDAIATAIKVTGSESWAHREIQSEASTAVTAIDAPFYLGSHEVTREQFELFVTQTGYVTTAEASGRGGWAWDENSGRDAQKPEYTWKNTTYVPSRKHPVVFVTLADAQAFCAWLSQKEGRTYVVPSEGRWEFACRAGTTTPWYCGAEFSALETYEWIRTNSDDRSHAVGGREPNPFGLFDMLGNVSELALDSNRKPVHRGGTTAFSPWLSRSASRYRIGEAGYSHARSGFRVAISDLKAKSEAPKSAPAPEVVQPLRDAVAAKGRALEYVRTRFELGAASKLDLVIAEAEWTETRIKLAEAEENKPALIERLEELVKQRSEERELFALRVEVGIDRKELLDHADARLAEAKSRLARVKPAPSGLPVAPAPRRVPIPAPDRVPLHDHNKADRFLCAVG
ncbi:serine threonine protein kinase : Serine/threonine protein kinase OS=Planctomyces maris DSM 8797 GN=PM8797T_04085 PE=3 SV=1: Pkinase: FGE-sulfatase [Gemmata massiliana]|uniref:non-specific serine/threonine protein kinase n=1 Tax=Gemmata massiliana TaxID=1210884 RepID=A0A6P2DEW4_9BACT|nr:bifunctional serine/threonine-protein kinase/formylglycine-generating enzyme family protein [Gemmata massiliana]VTS00211.1 serine threonine protein kinase : Serine/threonine protein kinase OS=Planctomyces maris DSM 8797 GN=PM8797T_04085 PE=3 SV=1: Pkinase: FGE-sulfatase [Gemmata massiliana]